MLRLIGLAVSIGLADSLNPTTIAPALYLAAGERSRERVAEFTFAVFAVYLAGGAAIALGPGQLLLSAIPHPDRIARHVIEVTAGAAMLLAAAPRSSTAPRCRYTSDPRFGCCSEAAASPGSFRCARPTTARPGPN